MKNRQISEIFNAIADLLELKDDNVFKIRAYRRAAMNVDNLSEDIEVLAKESSLEKIPGIGKDLAAKMIEMIDTGKCRYYEELKLEVPQAMLELISIPGVGPKTARLLYNKLGVKNINELAMMAKHHRISGLPGIKDKTEENILRGIALVKKRQERMTLKEAIDVAGEVVSALKKMPGVNNITPAGSLRRMRETVRDIDVLITSAKPEKVTGAFVKLPIVKDVLAHGDTKASILSREGVQVDLRVVEPDSFGAALVYFTGSQAHNIRIRHIGKEAGLKINEYGVFNEKSGKRIAGKTESDIYKTIKLPYIEPELREDRGEVEAGLKGALPKLIKLSDIRGDLHVHSEWSDGSDSIEDLAMAAKALGYEYIAITDHSESLKVAGGLSEKEVLKKLEEIRKVNKKLKGIRVLAGVEVDILKDGSLDYKDDILKRFDLVIAAIHTGFKDPKDKLTDRILVAMDNKRVNIIAHPTGRLMGIRGPYELYLDRIFKNAKEAGVALEISSFPERLDLDDVNARAAKDRGVKLAINTDAHIAEQMNYMALGVSVARRAWLEKEDVINTLSLDALLKFLKK
jgi:DNA polymerase (family 10)